MHIYLSLLTKLIYDCRGTETSRMPDESILLKHDTASFSEG